MVRQGGSSRCSQDPRYEQRVQEALRSLNDALAGALKISMEGNMKDLVARIKEHFHDHPELKENPRFAGLFP